MSAPVQARLTDAVAEEIRALLARKRWRQAQFATLLGVSEVWVSRRLSGKTEISLDDLREMADGLGVTVADLLPRSARQGTNGSSGILAEPAAPHAVRVTSPRGAARSATRRPVRTGRPLHTVPDRSPVVA